MMVASRVLARAGCSHCHASILRLLITPTPAPLTVARVTAVLRPVVTHRIARNYSSTPHLSDSTEAGSPREDTKQDNVHDNDSVVAPPEPRNPDVPWYLQVEPPRHVTSAEPPPLPEIPPNSPAIMESLLKYASEEMGLDDLSLLDLRELKPPPAFGPNLFMLFGTARGERHLNVSAGRLVRWLRAKHRVYADADGLLGPNERKTKLKRKAKKARLLGTMGTDDSDDGITTGWICVNLGTINRSSTESAVVSEDGRVAGFGVPQTGSTIVVQVMTESRRAELGLETLWQRSLARQSITTTQIDDKTPIGLHSLGTAARESATSTDSGRPADSAQSPFSLQSRSFSTVRTISISTASLRGHDGPNEPLLSPDYALGHILAYDGQQKARLMELLRIHIQEGSSTEANATLKSTSFLKLARLAMQNMPAEQTWALRLAIETRARQLGHREYQTLNNTQRLVREMRLYGIPATRDQYLQLISCIYSLAGLELSERTSLAHEVLETVHTRGQPIIANDIIVAMIEAMSYSREPGEPAEQLRNRLEELMLQAKLPYMGEGLVIKLMESYARLGKWDKYWEAWRIPPRFLQPRSEDMYVHIYNLAATGKHSALCSETIRQCFPEMINEEPPVLPVGRVRDAVLSCVRIADPKAEEHAENIPVGARGTARSLANREFVKLVRNLKQRLA